VKGDATAAYSPAKVSLFTREMVYLKPDIFVVFDRVTATSASYKKRWLLHSVNEPTVSGDTVTVQEGSSRLFVKSLLPAPRTITKVGGSGHQFDVNGTNYPPSQTVTPDMGAWRFEVSPTVDAQEHQFLHVLYVCGSGTSSMPEARLVEGEAMVGVEVAGHVVMFSRTGAMVDEESYEYGE
jgi:heparin/heparan-sulfate lyase